MEEIKQTPLTVRYSVRRRFSAAHSLPHYEGPCAKVHGHTWVVDIAAVVSGVPDKSGIIVDFRVFKDFVDQFDHEHLNNLVDTPSAELLATYIAKQLANWLCDSVALKVLDVTVWESEDCAVTVSWPPSLVQEATDERA